MTNAEVYRRRMRRDIAERLAATRVEGLSVEDTRKVLNEYLLSLALCEVCGNTGTITFGRDLYVAATDDLGRPLPEAKRRVRAGTPATCPRCGDEQESLSGKGDPDFVAWLCLHGEGNRECRYKQGKDPGEPDAREHADCGWRLVLPLPEPPTG